MTHETRDGQVVMVALMDDTHLKNVVGMHLKRIKEAKDCLGSGTNLRMQEALYGVKTRNLEQKMIQQIEKSREALPPYIMECMIRGIDYREELIQVFDREVSKMKANPVLNLFQQEIQKEPKLLPATTEAELDFDDLIDELNNPF